MSRSRPRNSSVKLIVCRKTPGASQEIIFRGCIIELDLRLENFLFPDEKSPWLLNGQDKILSVPVIQPQVFKCVCVCVCVCARVCASVSVSLCVCVLTFVLTLTALQAELERKSSGLI